MTGKKTNAWDDNPSKEKEEVKVLKEDKSKLLVRIIEDDTNCLHDTLGIGEEGSKKIQDMIYDHIEADRKKGIDKSNVSELMVEISKKCVHANELAFACFALGRITGEMSSGGPSMMGAIGINRKTGDIKHFGASGDNLPDFLKDILKDILKGKKDKEEE